MNLKQELVKELEKTIRKIKDDSQKVEVDVPFIFDGGKDTFEAYRELCRHQIMIFSLSVHLQEARKEKSLDDMPAGYAQELVKHFIGKVEYPDIIEHGLYNDGHDLQRLRETIDNYDAELALYVYETAQYLEDLDNSPQDYISKFDEFQNMMKIRLIIHKMYNFYKDVMSVDNVVDSQFRLNDFE